MSKNTIIMMKNFEAGKNEPIVWKIVVNSLFEERQFRNDFGYI
jgi:hypothetical protein